MIDRFDLLMIFQDHSNELVEYYGDDQELAYEEAASTSGFFASSSTCATVIRRYYKEFPEERETDRRFFVDQAYEIQNIISLNDW